VSDQYISLTLGDLSLTIFDYQLSGNRFPRLPAKKAANARSADGNFVGYGQIYEPPNLFSFTAFLDWDEWKLVDGLYKRHVQRFQAKRPLNEVELLVIDTTTELQEDAPRTRATAPAPFNSVTSLTVTNLSYFAQYYCWFASEPEFDRKGARVETAIALEESDRKVAP